jgi:ribosomal protein S18 acetylase RimI-like enzyme
MEYDSFSFGHENYSYLDNSEQPTVSNNNTNVQDFDDFSIEIYNYNNSKLSYLSNYIYPFWRQQFINKKEKEKEKETDKKDMFNPCSSWSNSDIARHNMGLKDNTLCFQMMMSNIPMGFCSLLLLDEYDRTDRFSPFSNDVYTNALVLYNLVIDTGFRGNGYGKQLINIIINYINVNYNNYKYIILYVDKDNEVAISLYKSLGFTLVGDNPADKEQDLYRYSINATSN